MQIITLQELSAQLQYGKPIICFDFGAKKIGVALSTPDHLICMPHSIIRESSAAKQLDACSKAVLQHNVCAIIVGLPLNMDGTENEQTNNVRKFAEKLAVKSGIDVYLQDERMTSKTADNLLKTIGMNRKSRNAKDDSVAANLILETTLNLLSMK